MVKKEEMCSTEIHVFMFEGKQRKEKYILSIILELVKADGYAHLRYTPEQPPPFKRPLLDINLSKPCGYYMYQLL
jgi:hypothetical protein